jgi:hypothetical protein
MTTEKLTPADRFSRSDQAFAAMMAHSGGVRTNGYPAAAPSDFAARMDTGVQHGPQAPWFRSVASMDAAVYGVLSILSEDAPWDVATRATFVCLSGLPGVDSELLRQRIAHCLIARILPAEVS